MTGAVKADAQLDVLFNLMDDLLSGGFFMAVDRITIKWDPKYWDTAVNVGILTVTLQAKEKLRFRDSLVRRIENHLLTKETPERVRALLRGLR